MPDLFNKTVIITGASRGIGAAAAQEFARHGANVVLAARSVGTISDIASLIEGAGGKALAEPCDVSNLQDVENLVESCTDRFGTPDILINNAGMLEPVERIEESTPDAWDQVIDVNVKGVYYGIRACLPAMKQKGGGTIITVGSGAASSALEGWSAYCTSKAAVHHLNSCLHKEESDHGIRAMIMSPGTVATKMQEVIRESGVNPVSQIPWEDHVSPEAIAKVFVWMCGAEADGYLGQTVALRGEDLKRVVENVKAD